MPAIVAEVERLLSVYGGNRSFRRYATAFLSTANAAFAALPLCDSKPPTVDPAGDMPLEVRVALGQLSLAARPIPGDWALSWYFSHPEVRPRTPARRCPEEFRSLFLARYAERLGAGIVVKPNKTRLRGAYVPASASFGGEVPVELGNLPDVMALSKPFRAIEEVAEECTSALEPYSRLVGRDPASRGSLEAIALLPSELASPTVSSAAASFRDWLEGRLASGMAFVDGAELQAHWPTSRKDRFLRSEAVALSQLLEKLGFAFEPDVRFGGPALTAVTKAVLFRFPSEHREAPSRAYVTATALLGLAALVASADGEVSEAEERHLEKHLETALHLEPAERVRLSAHLRWLLAAQPGLSGLRKRLGDVDEATRSAIARFATLVAGVDGQVDPAEVKTLQRIYRTLGIDEQRVFSDVHLLGEAITSPPAGTGHGAPGAAGRAGIRCSRASATRRRERPRYAARAGEARGDRSRFEPSSRAYSKKRKRARRKCLRHRWLPPQPFPDSMSDTAASLVRSETSNRYLDTSSKKSHNDSVSYRREP